MKDTSALPPSTADCLLTAWPDYANSRLRVLLVEDDEVDRLAIHRYIGAQALPYTVVDAPDVAAARAALATGQFDVLLLDHQLPDGTGFDVLAGAAQAPAIFITGANDLALAVQAVREGAADYLVKDTARHYLQMLAHTIERSVAAHRTRTLLRRSRQLCHQALDEAPVAKIITNPEGRVLKANRAACTLFGRTEAELVAGGLAPLCPGVSAQLLQQVPQVPAQGLTAPFQLEIDCRHHSGALLRILLHVSHVRDETGRTLLHIFQFQDLTEIRRIERQLEQARRLEAIGTLASGVAHEFNNLLTTIILNLQLVDAEFAVNDPPRECTQAALAASDRARTLVSRLLTFSRQAAGPGKRTHLPRLVRDAVATLARSLPPSVTILPQIDDTCPAVAGDPGEFQEALRQLTDNAVRAMAAGGGTLSIVLSHGEPAADLRQRHPQVAPHHTVQLAVRDTGMGMTPEQLERLFEPFHTTREPGQGTGLGLATIYGTTRRLRGAVAVESTPGLGTTVRLFFAPAAPPVTEPSTAPPAPELTTRRGI